MQNYLYAEPFPLIMRAHKQTTLTKHNMKTEITNTFTGYTKTITTKDFPSVKTIAKHIRASKASDCKSVTYIYIDGVGYDLNMGELMANGQYADA